MKRNAMGQPRPWGHEEMLEAMEEKGAIGDELHAIIEHQPEGTGDFAGWSAEVLTNEEGQQIFCTMGYERISELKEHLVAVGITDIMGDNE
jgi:arginyl-tRNA--protein-N-Asp/Glu arginylyltransferase